MVYNIQYCDGKLFSKEQLRKMLTELDRPLVFTNMINDWPSAKWTIDGFTQLFGHIITKFKLFNRVEKKEQKENNPNNTQRSASSISMETDCFYADATFKNFHAWLNNNDDNEDHGELKRYSKDSHWCYADYNYMAKLFKDHPEILDAVDWSIFGHEGRNGYQSTIWIGSEESFTPCHQDTYGSNLIAQIFGVKRWLLFPPCEREKLQPTRIPYEESSIFASSDVKQLQGIAYQVDLKPGEVLFVPKHWWHYVESISHSISINTWIEQENDPDDRLRESLVQFLVYSIKTNDNKQNTWLNPKQELPKSLDECLQVIRTSFKEKFKMISDASLDEKFSNADFIVNCLTETNMLDKMIDSISKKL